MFMTQNYGFAHGAGRLFYGLFIITPKYSKSSGDYPLLLCLCENTAINNDKQVFPCV